MTTVRTRTRSSLPSLLVIEDKAVTSTEGISHSQHYEKFAVRLDSVAPHKWIGVHFVWMTSRTRFWAVAALLALLGTPSLSCFVPRQLLNAGESDCCRQMGDQCGSETMPSSQSCCESPSQVSQPYISSVTHPGPSSAGVVLAILPISPVALPCVMSLAPTFVQFHSPPLSPPEANSVLRI